MTSRLFRTDRFVTAQCRIQDFLNIQDRFLSSSTVGSPRAVGDAIQAILGEHFQTIIGADICVKYSSQFARPRRQLSRDAQTWSDPSHRSRSIPSESRPTGLDPELSIEVRRSRLTPQPCP